MGSRLPAKEGSNSPLFRGVVRFGGQTAPVPARLARHSSNEDGCRGWLAERVGFEPTIRFWRILTFQASAFDHSATAPHLHWKARP